MLKIYDYWGEKNEPPSHLKTKKQLSELGLKPKEPVGVIHCRKYDLYLYDPNNPESCTPKRKPTEKQLAALAQAREAAEYKAAYREWRQEFGSLIRAKNEAIQTAKEIASKSNHWLILDTETTGLSNPEVIQIAIINLDGDILLDSLIKPTIPIESEAIAFTDNLFNWLIVMVG